MEAPLFLVAAERSGTTLLRLMLDGHPQIAWPCEFDYALEWPEAKPGEWPDLVDFWSALAANRQARQARVQIDAKLEFPDLVRSLYAQLRARTRKPIVGVTAHGHYEQLLRLWPDARFIYLVRDGRDVARSHVEMGWAGNVWAAAKVWRDAEHAWRSLATRIPEERRIELRYEALVREPERELTRLCAFLGVDYAPELLEYPLRSTVAAPDARLAERWREQLSARDLSLLAREIGPELAARGYAASDERPAWIPAPRRAALWLDDRIGRLRFRMRRYGVGLWLERQLTRRLGLGGALRVFARMQTIDSVLLK